MSDPEITTRPVTDPLGCLEKIQYGGIVGWYIDRCANGDANETIMVFANGTLFAEVGLSIVRPDVMTALGTPARCGFSCKLGPFEQGRVHRLSACVKGSSYDFDGSTIRWCPLVDRFIGQLRELFMPGHYTARSGYAGGNDDETFAHFIETGIYEGYDPNPWFDSAFVRARYAGRLKDYDIPVIGFLALLGETELNPSRYFDSAYYRDVNGLPPGSPSALAHHVGEGHRQFLSVEPFVLPGRVADELAELKSLEPALPSLERLDPHIVCYPHVTPGTWTARRLRTRIPQEIQAVVCMPFIGLGGADLIGTYVLRAMQKQFGADRVLLVVTETDRIDTKVRVDSDTLVATLFSDGIPATLEDRVRTLHEILGEFSPDRVVNINSHACWELTRAYGRQLSSVMDLYAYLFCFDYASDGTLGGYIGGYLPDCVRHLRHVYFDNAQIIDDTCRLFGLPASVRARFSTVYTPIPADLATHLENAAGRSDRPQPRVLWTGRMARQKRPDRLVALAEAMPSVEFCVYGPPGDAECKEAIMLGEIPNVVYMGTYQSLDELDLRHYAAFVNTSDWDGLPTVLIQMAAGGLPVVTSMVGGIHELIDDSTGWRIEREDDISAYAAAISKVLLNPEEAASRAKAAAALVAERHSWETFEQALTGGGLCSANAPTAARVEAFEEGEAPTRAFCRAA